MSPTFVPSCTAITLPSVFGAAILPKSAPRKTGLRKRAVKAPQILLSERMKDNDVEILIEPSGISSQFIQLDAKLQPVHPNGVTPSPLVGDSLNVTTTSTDVKVQLTCS